MSVRDALRVLRRFGWAEIPGGKGSHRKLAHRDGRRTVVSGRLGDTIPRGLWVAIMMQTGIEWDPQARKGKGGYREL